MNWAALRLSLQVTLVATTILFVVGLILGVLLARFRVRGQIIIETIIFLPLVLPPSVIGYFLLLTLGRGSPTVEWFHVHATNSGESFVTQPRDQVSSDKTSTPRN